MPNDPPYGGQIKVNKNGSVTWTVSAREYPSYRDIDGTVEFAIRVVDKDRNIITSSDGKCIVHVHTDEIESENRHLRFLIVSGYDMPAAPDNTTIVGKSYFVTMNRSPEFAENETLPRYDLILQYDDYDLEEADLQKNLDLEDLHVCHENWISVSSLWNQLIGYSAAELAESAGVDVLTRKTRPIAQEKLGFPLAPHSVMATIERKLRSAGVNRDLWDILEKLVEGSTTDSQKQEEDLPAGTRAIERQQDNRQEHTVQANSVPEKPSTSIGTINEELWVSRWHEVVESPKGADSRNASIKWAGEPKMTIEGKVDKIINEEVVYGERIKSPPGSKAITVKGIQKRGLFVLMYHGPSNEHTSDSH